MPQRKNKKEHKILSALLCALFGYAYTTIPCIYTFRQNPSFLLFIFVPAEKGFARSVIKNSVYEKIQPACLAVPPALPHRL